MIPEVPEGYVVLAVFAPPEHRRTESWIAQVADRRFSRGGQVVATAGAVLVAGSIIVPRFVARISSTLSGTALAVGILAGIAGWLLLNPPGRSGYFDVRDDGSLGGKLSGEELDLDGWRRIPLDGGPVT
jgi:protein-S-isoprenylcysteine O-methyltransferase Ste14